MAVSQLRATIKPVTDAAYDSFSGGPNEKASEVIGGSLIVVGRGPDGYWLYEIDRNNGATNYTEDGFHTIGSGSLGSHIGRRFLGHYMQAGYEAAHMRLLAYRFVESCIDVLPGYFGIGGDVQMWQSTEDRFAPLDVGELAAVRDALQQWCVAEQGTIFTVAGTPPEVPSELPEKLSDGDPPPS
jgi:hypothetical protein